MTTPTFILHSATGESEANVRTVLRITDSPSAASNSRWHSLDKSANSNKIRRVE